MSDALTKARLDQIVPDWEAGISFCQDEAQSIDFNGKKYVADDTKGFLLAKMAHSFPVVTAHGQALHPNVVAASWKSLIYQGGNLEHSVINFDRENIHRDKFTGSVLDASFPSSPYGGFKIGPIEDVPAIEFVASFSKMAQGVDTILGKHQGGRHKYTVSMEVSYRYSESGFAIALNGKQPQFETPDDMVESGFEFCSWLDAPDELRDSFSIAKKKITKNYKNRKTVHMMGGLNSPVHFGGFAIVAYGAEPTAKIMRMAASGSIEAAAVVAFAPLRKFVDKVSEHRGFVR